MDVDEGEATTVRADLQDRGLPGDDFRETVKQVTTLPWHITPKGTLYGPIYGIYMG